MADDDVFDREFPFPTEADRALSEKVLLAAERAGVAHNGGAGGQYILVATPQQLARLAKELLDSANKPLDNG